MVLKYYYDLLSQPCRAIYIFLKVTKIPFEEHPLSLLAGESKQGEFSKLTAMQRVPVIDDDGFVLSESVVILKYLALKYKVPTNWYPSEFVAQIRIDECVHWQHLGLRIQEARLFLNLYLFPKRNNKPVDWNEVETYRAAVTKAVGEMENYFLKGKQYLNSDDISIADLLCVCELMQLNAVFEEDLYESNAAVSAWVKRVKEKVGPVFDEAHKTILGVREGFVKPEQKK